MLGAIERDQHPVVEATERGERAGGVQSLAEQRVERLRRGAVQHLADGGVGGNAGDGEQGLAVGAALAFFEAALIGEERGAADEEQGEGGQHDVGHAVGVLAQRPLARVGEGGRDGPHGANEGGDQAHTDVESAIRHGCKGIVQGSRAAKRSRAPGVADRTQPAGASHSRLELLPNLPVAGVEGCLSNMTRPALPQSLYRVNRAH